MENRNYSDAFLVGYFVICTNIFCILLQYIQPVPREATKITRDSGGSRLTNQCQITKQLLFIRIQSYYSEFRSKEAKFVRDGVEFEWKQFPTVWADPRGHESSIDKRVSYSQLCRSSSHLYTDYNDFSLTKCYKNVSLCKLLNIDTYSTYQ